MSWNRRNFIGGVAAAGLVSGCAGQSASRDLNAQADEALRDMQRLFPFTRQILSQASGVLIMPRIAKGGFFVGGAYGEGVLRVGGAPVDYYSIAAGSYGLQIGAHRFSNVLFLMTPKALNEFRARDGWTLGVDLEAAVSRPGAIRRHRYDYV